MTGEPQRKDIPEIPYEALREALINTVAHRDYFETGTNVKGEMFDDRIEISNPGGLVPGLPKEAFGKRSVLRNPNIANLLDKINYIEKLGTGITKIRTLLDQNNLPPAHFEFDTFFTVTFQRPGEKSKVEDEVTISDEFSTRITFGDKFREQFKQQDEFKGKKLDRLIRLLSDIYSDIPIEHSVYEDEFSISNATVRRDLNTLKELNLIKFKGPKKSGRYVLTEHGKIQLRSSEKTRMTNDEQLNG